MTATLWLPDYDLIRSSAIERFALRYANCSATDYPKLHQWSLDNPATFWSSVWDFCDIQGKKGTGPWLLEHEHIKDSIWFPDSRMNYAQNLLRENSDTTAIICRTEHGERRHLSHRQLYLQTCRLAFYFRQCGIRPADRIVACLPNSAETVVAFLAASAIGAVWSSCSPDFGAQGIIDRFGQVEAKIFLCAESYSWKGRTVDIREKMEHVVDMLPTVQTVIEIPFLDLSKDQTTIKNAISWNTALDNSCTKLVFEQLAFDHPLYILFSSGTTGVPKCIVHRAGGMLLQHCKELHLHNNINSDDTVFFYTTCGWMMWNWLVSALAVDASIVLYDGAPLHPHPHVLFNFAEQENITFFGTSASYITALRKAGASLTDSHSLEHMKTIGSTGSVLTEESFDYVYEHIHPRARLSSMSGGTDIASCFVLGNPVLPVVRGQIQCAGLGMEVDVVDDNGHSQINKKGELVCRNTFPSMPKQFWNDDDGNKYHQAYFAKFVNVWLHGDYAMQTETGNFIIYGRSDATLNPGGVRIGSAEIYRQTEKVPQIQQSLAIGHTRGEKSSVILFVVLHKDVQFDESLQRTIRDVIRNGASPRHVPDAIFAVPDIPRTRNGKLVEIAVRDILDGKKVANVESIANPESLDFFTTITIPKK